MNPEFRRNLWIGFSQFRAIAGPLLVLALIFGLSAAAAMLTARGRGYFGFASAGILFVLLTQFWGTRQAAAAVIGEMRARTWDSQRLTAQGPGAFALGKLFGTTAFSWYLAIFCLPFIWWPLKRYTNGANALHFVLCLSGTGLVAQATALLSSLAEARRNQGRLHLLISPHQLIGILAGFYCIQLFADEIALAPRTYTYTTRTPLLAMLPVFYVFLAWCLLGIRQMLAQEFGQRARPALWWGFLGFAALAAELVRTKNFLLIPHAGTAPGAGAYGALLLAGHGALYFSIKKRVLWARFLRAARQLRLAEALARMPGWAAALALMVPAAATVAIAAPDSPAARFALCTLPFFIRDAAIIVWLNLRPNAARADLAGITTLSVLHGLAPGLLALIGGQVVEGLHVEGPIADALRQLSGLVSGFGAPPLAVALPAGILQAGLCLGLVAGAWRRGR